MNDQFYLQDSRNFVGNDLVFWAKNGAGYSTDVSKAHVFTKNEAMSQHESRKSDIPWPKEYIDNKTRPAVDFQYVKNAEALKGTGILIKKEKPMKIKKSIQNCHQCGRFLSVNQVFNNGGCPKCGADNRP